jgi:signal transduction histidine kinase
MTNSTHEERRLRFLADASRVLVASLDYDVTLASVARLAVPEIADMCTIDVIEKDGMFRRVAAGHADPRKEAVTRELATYAPRLEAECCPIAHAVRTREPVIVADVDDAVLCNLASNEAELRLLRSLEISSFISVPLTARGRTLGAISLLATSPRRYANEDLGLVMDLAGPAALAVDNARLFRESERLYGESLKASAARDEVLQIVSHDLRNPLNVITVAASLMRQEITPGEDRRLRQIERIERAAKRMTRLIEDLLDITRIDAGTLPIEPQLLDAAQLINDAREILRPLAAEKGIRLELDPHPSLPSVDGDRDRIIQVFANLIGNAIKFTPRDGAIMLRAEPREREVVFSVRDTGPGILAEHQARIFERFWQARTAVRQGAGLGLAIAKGIVEAHGGRIWVESEVGFGSTFFFTLRSSAGTAH